MSFILLFKSPKEPISLGKGISPEKNTGIGTERPLSRPTHFSWKRSWSIRPLSVMLQARKPFLVLGLSKNDYFTWEKCLLLTTSSPHRHRMKKRNSILFIVFLGVLGFVYWGSRNEVDPEWTAMDAKLDRHYLTLADAQDSTKILFEKIHGRPADDTEISDRIGRPFIPSVQFSKFSYYTQEVVQNKFAVFSSVIGSGTSTLIDRLARFVATDESHMLRVFGAVNFDMEYHRQFIGEEVNGVWQQGLLLDFFDRCLANPDEKFVMVFNDIHKVEPETFFGQKLWYKLYDRKVPTQIGGKTIVIPPNFHMISVAHVIPNAKVLLTEDHYRRIGNLYRIEPDDTELIFYLRGQLENGQKSLSESPKAKPFVYAFNRANQIVSDKFNKSYTVGQWSNLRKLCTKSTMDDMLDYFVAHVNSFAPRKEMSRADLKPIEYAVQNEGKLSGSNFFSTQFRNLEEKGFLTEFIVGLSFIIISALSSFFIFKRREKIISEQILMVNRLFREFEAKTKDYDTISNEIDEIKDSVDHLALKKKISYEEATFFYQYFYDKTRKIEIAKEARNHFEDLIYVSLDDGILSDKEHQKLLEFLNRIKTRIGESDYRHFKEEIDRIQAAYSKN